MKAPILLTLIFLPLLILAQDVDASKAQAMVTDYDWINIDHQGYVMEIRGDSIMFEEEWMIPSPAGLQISSPNETGETTTFSTYEAPYWAEATYYRKGKFVYLLKLRFLKQCSYDSDGKTIIGTPEDNIE
jgi:hypothetical protein